MKIRLTQPGWERYTGQMGVLWFEDGMSTGDVRVQDAIRMAATMLCEWEDGTSPNVAQSILDHASTPAPVFATGADGQHDKEVADKPADKSVPVEQKPAGAGWTEEKLVEVADKQGIKGLRAIAEPMGLKGTSINELMSAILKKQGQ